MFDCPSCMLRCLRAITADAAVTSRTALSRRPCLPPAARRAPLNLRTYIPPSATSKSGTTERNREAKRKTKDQDGNSKIEEGGDSLLKDTPYEFNSRRAPRHRRASPSTDHDITPTDKFDSEVREELKYLKDPLKLANQVKHMLRGNELVKSLALMRMASKSMQCIVGWNHCIDWLLANRHTQEALKIYNEMKKRAQFPDSHTYLLILRGLSNPPVEASNVGVGLSVYHSMTAPNARVAPTIIHTNAMLKLCSRAYDMDSLWSIASRIPDTGPGSADHLTFTTILNAIKENATVGGGFSEQEKTAHNASRQEQAVVEGRRIWEDIIGKWKSGDIQMDEELVVSMGKLLLIGQRPRDWDDVLSLVEQTMDIGRLMPKLGSAARQAEHIRGYADESKTPVNDKGEGEEDDMHLPVGAEFDKGLVRKGRKNSQQVILVEPGNKTLALIMDACRKMMAARDGTQYWELLTSSDGYGIKPDQHSVVTYLKLQAQSRASLRALEFLRSYLQEDYAEPSRKIFRAAMGACARDRKNTNVMTHASGVLDLMRAHLPDVDPKASLVYLELALESQSGPVIVSALEHLAPVITGLKSQLSYGHAEGHASLANPNDAEDIEMLFRTVISAVDTLLNKAMVPRDEYSAWMQRRSKLAAFVSRQKTKEEGRLSESRKGKFTKPQRIWKKEGSKIRFVRNHDVAKDGPAKREKKLTRDEAETVLRRSQEVEKEKVNKAGTATFEDTPW